MRRRFLPLLLPALLLPAAAEEKPQDLNDLLLQLREVAGVLVQHGYGHASGETLPILNALVQAVDPRLELLTPDEAERRLETWRGWSWSTGIQTGWKDGQVVVRSVDAGSPAAEAGLEPGQVLVQAGDRVLQDLAQPDIDATLTTRGPGTVRLLLGPPAGGADPIELSTARRPRPLIGLAEVLGSEIAYIRIPHVGPGAAAAVRQAVEALTVASPFGLIADLRGSGGSAWEEIPALARYLSLSPGRPVRRMGAEGMETVGEDAAAKPALGIPTMLLVDGHTAGAAELLAAVARDEGRYALLVGQTTAGDFGLRTRVPVLGGHEILLATGKLATLDQAYDGRSGLIPTIAVASARRRFAEPEPLVAEGRREVLDSERTEQALRRRIRSDAALERAVEVLLGIQALGRREPAAGRGDDL